MNDLYTNELSILHNYFMPNIKLKDKVRIQSKIKKVYEKAATPHQRLMKSSFITPEQKKQLDAVFLANDPITLKQQIEKKLKRIFYYVNLGDKKKRKKI